MSSILTRLVTRYRPQPTASGATGSAGAVSPQVLLGWYARKGATAAVRGLVRRPLLGSAVLPLFLGRNVRIDYARRLHLGRAVQLGAGSMINAFSVEGVRLGDGVTIRENAWIQCTSHPANPGVGLTVGARTYIGPGAVIGPAGRIEIGAGCQFGARVTLIAENHAVIDGVPSATEVVRLGIRIGDGCWLGHGATVLDGVTLGEHCVVGAGAVVTKSFPAGSRLVGVPARAIG
jgi:acetyltransferase-like isoleucine patch superfamily enzyme